MWLFFVPHSSHNSYIWVDDKRMCNFFFFYFFFSQLTHSFFFLKNNFSIGRFAAFQYSWKRIFFVKFDFLAASRPFQCSLGVFFVILAASRPFKYSLIEFWNFQTILEGPRSGQSKNIKNKKHCESTAKKKSKRKKSTHSFVIDPIWRFLFTHKKKNHFKVFFCRKKQLFTMFLA